MLRLLYQLKWPLINLLLHKTGQRNISILPYAHLSAAVSYFYILIPKHLIDVNLNNLVKISGSLSTRLQ